MGDVILVAALAELRGWGQYANETEEEVATQVFRVTASEQRTLKVAAAQSGCTMGDLIRRALFAYGLIGERNVDQE